MCAATAQVPHLAVTRWGSLACGNRFGCGAPRWIFRLMRGNSSFRTLLRFQQPTADLKCLDPFDKVGVLLASVWRQRGIFLETCMNLKIESLQLCLIRDRAGRHPIVSVPSPSQLNWWNPERCSSKESYEFQLHHFHFLNYITNHVVRMFFFNMLPGRISWRNLPLCNSGLFAVAGVNSKHSSPMAALETSRAKRCHFVGSKRLPVKNPWPLRQGFFWWFSTKVDWICKKAAMNSNFINFHNTTQWLKELQCARG